VPSDRKASLISLFAWLDNVPAYKGGDCHFCKRDYSNADVLDKFRPYWEPGTNYVEKSLKWNGYLRSCCTVCLDEKYKSMKIEQSSCA